MEKISFLEWCVSKAEASAETPSQIQFELTQIAKRLKTLRRKRGRVKGRWYDEAKNKLDGFTYLLGYKPRAFSPKESAFDCILSSYRHYYFADIRFRSRMRKINDKITIFERRYDYRLGQLKALLPDFL